ncbi:MAG: leucine-rich repeat domain-containing protein [Rhodospirillales bacterium]|nr:leucine-rich repeat domain-containing protein [Rhodospirillales bacterium]
MSDTFHKRLETVQTAIKKLQEGRFNHKPDNIDELLNIISRLPTEIRSDIAVELGYCREQLMVASEEWYDKEEFTAFAECMDSLTASIEYVIREAIKLGLDKPLGSLVITEPFNDTAPRIQADQLGDVLEHLENYDKKLDEMLDLVKKGPQEVQHQYFISFVNTFIDNSKIKIDLIRSLSGFAIGIKITALDQLTGGLTKLADLFSKTLTTKAATVLYKVVKPSVTVLLKAGKKVTGALVKVVKKVLKSTPEQEPTTEERLDVSEIEPELLEVISNTLGKPFSQATKEELNNLQYLNLSKTSVTNIAPLTEIKNLQYLTLSKTSVIDIAPLVVHKDLQTLYLSGTSISDITPLAELKNLLKLYLSGTSISDITPLAELKNLQYLYLSNTSVSDIAPLAEFKNLRCLHLSGTSVNNYVVLKQLDKLERLYLSSTSQMRELREELQKANPYLVIEYD